MHRTLFITALLIGLLISLGIAASAADRPALHGKNDEINYSVGHQIGRDLLRQQVKVNPEVLLQGIIDATSGNEPLMPFDQMITTLAELREKIVKLAEQQKLDIRQAGQKFLSENKTKAGVVTLASGLQYKILQTGSGPQPASGDQVRVAYSGQDIYGQQFDSTTKNGTTSTVEFNIDKVIPGWAEALKMMPEGSEWELYIPYNLAFKDSGPLAGQTVVYKIKLIKVNP